MLSSTLHDALAPPTTTPTVGVSSQNMLMLTFLRTGQSSRTTSNHYEIIFIAMGRPCTIKEDSLSI